MTSKSFEGFLSNIRHELATPLNAVIGYSEMLREDAQEAGESSLIDRFTRIQMAGKELLSIVNAVVDPARLQSRGVGPDMEGLRVSLRDQLLPHIGIVLDTSMALKRDIEETGQDDLASDVAKIHSAAGNFLAFIDDAAIFSMAGVEIEPAGSAGPVGGETPDSLTRPGAALSTFAPAADILFETGTAALLVVDDNEMNRDLLSRYLRRRGYGVTIAEDGPRALEMLRTHAFDLVLLDVLMPGMNGYEVCRICKSDPGMSDIPVLFLSALTELKDKTAGFEAGGVDYITKPLDLLEVNARVETHLALLAARRALAGQNAILEQRVKERTREIVETQKEVILRLGLATEMRDTDTGMHIQRIRGYTELLALECGLSTEESELLGLASTLHDIGKIAIPDHILLKPGKLEDAEMAVMKTHAALGAKSLEDGCSKLLDAARIIALTHHERWDGKGYPAGLKGEEIPLAGRIVGLVDVFDALTTKRPYKDAWPVEKAVQFVRDSRGTQFDPKVCDRFLDALSAILVVREECRKNER